MSEKYKNENRDYIRIKNNKYMRGYYLDNREILKEKRKKYTLDRQDVIKKYRRHNYLLNKEFILSKNRKNNKHNSEHLTDTYIKKRVKDQTGLNDPPQELIEQKRLIIKLKRTIKQKQNESTKPKTNTH